MTEQELRQKIAEYICGSDESDPFHAFDISNAGARVNHILALTDAYYKEKYKDKIYSQEEAQGLVDAAMIMARKGYVKLSPDQTLPTTELGLSLKQVAGFKQTTWRKVELESS